MDAARQGIVTPQMKIVAEKEHFNEEELRKLIAKGEVIIPCNMYKSKRSRRKAEDKDQCESRRFPGLERRGYGV